MKETKQEELALLEADVASCECDGEQLVVTVEPAKANPLADLVKADGKKLSLVDMLNLYREIEDALIESGGLAELGDQLAAVEGKIEQKLDNCKGLIEYWKGQITYLDDREKMYKNRKIRIKNGIDWMKNCMKAALFATGKEKIKTTEGTYYFIKPKSPVRILPEYMTPQYAAALQKLGLRRHNVVITIPATYGGEVERFAAELKQRFLGLTVTVTEPEYDLEGIHARWSKGNRRWPKWLVAAEKGFAIR
ncbi:MAG: siphovirus Gp157 family protein [Chlorobium sp.]|uniref:siphovirus Gp157 family protein n=1 Tax=Chlorobium sp. TaxID=1095 RepID=UPI002F4184BC